MRARTGETPVVLDSEDVLKDRAACSNGSAGGSASPSTSGCCTGRRDAGETDGIWAEYSFNAVERSTGFEPWSPRPRQVAPELEPLLAECLPYYEELAGHRLRA